MKTDKILTVKGSIGMEKQFQWDFFLAVRMGLLLVIEIYIVVSHYMLAGVSAWVLLLLACFTGASAGKELTGKKGRWIMAVVSCILCVCIIWFLGNEFLLLGIYTIFEMLYIVKPGILWYFIPVIPAFATGWDKTGVQILETLLLGIVYIQNDFVVAYYKEMVKNDVISSQQLKKSLYKKEDELREEINKRRLKVKNQILEERASLSQELHDKLGHAVNGSIYQLEAVKLLIEKKPGTAKSMTQAVISELRNSMDEIRAILRNETPKKHEMALIQLDKLCIECRQKGIEAEFFMDGELSQVPEDYLEIILDNSYEAVSNSLKYSGCTKIEIKIYVMNKVVRCLVSDNGKGCSKLTDGMGISGMRKRIRAVNGIIGFETENGFSINMLFPR